MRVVHFTFRGYGTWLPNHPKGWNSRTTGWQPTDDVLGAAYASRMVHGESTFSYRMQRRALAAMIESGPGYGWKPYAMVGSKTHIHAAVGWKDGRSTAKVGGSLKASMTRALNEIERRDRWFVKSCGRRNVLTELYLAHLIDVYFPRHRGWMWSRDRGWTFSRSRSDGSR